MSALAQPRSRPGALGWIAAGVLAGGTVGIATAVEPLLGVAVLLLPALGWLFARPELLPPVLVVTVFAESLEIGGLTISRLSAPLALAILLARLVTRG